MHRGERQQVTLRDVHPELLARLALRGGEHRLAGLDVPGRTAGPVIVAEAGVAAQLEEHLRPAVRTPARPVVARALQQHVGGGHDDEAHRTRREAATRSTARSMAKSGSRLRPLTSASAAAVAVIARASPSGVQPDSSRRA